MLPRLSIRTKPEPKPKLEVEIDQDRLVSVTVRDGHVHITGYGYLDQRSSGQFQDHAVYLPPAVDWVLGIDNEGETVVVPLRKSPSAAKPA